MAERKFKNKPRVNLRHSELLKEKWKDVPEYEGIYQFSNYGRLRKAYKNKEDSWFIITTTHFFLNKPDILYYKLTKDKKK